MEKTKEIQRIFNEVLGSLPEEARAGVSIQYGYSTPFGTVDVVIHRNGECMALGRFRAVSKQAGSDFVSLYKLAMGFPEECWYYFDFDGERMVLNDLSLSHALDEYPESAAAGISRLLMHPEEWKSNEKKLLDMKRFVDLLHKAVDGE